MVNQPLHNCDGQAAKDSAAGTLAAWGAFEARRAALNRVRATLEDKRRARRTFFFVRLALIMILMPAALLNAVFLALLIIQRTTAGAPGIPEGALILTTITACLLGLTGAIHLIYLKLGGSIDRYVRNVLDGRAPEVAACVVASLSRPCMPGREPYLEQLAQLTSNMGRAEWEMMRKSDINSIVAAAADHEEPWAQRIGLAAAHSAVRHGEIRALAALREAHYECDRWRRTDPNCAELAGLISDLEAQAAALRSTNLLVRPADGSPELLRVAADGHNQNDSTLLVRPVAGNAPAHRSLEINSEPRE